MTTLQHSGASVCPWAPLTRSRSQAPDEETSIPEYPRVVVSLGRRWDNRGFDG